MDENLELISVVDDNGTEHLFEELDRIELDNNKRYVALLPAIENDDEEDSEELIILRVFENGQETYLEPIEDDEEFNEISQIFVERLSEIFNFE